MENSFSLRFCSDLVATSEEISLTVIKQCRTMVVTQTLSLKIKMSITQMLFAFN